MGGDRPQGRQFGCQIRMGDLNISSIQKKVAQFIRRHTAAKPAKNKKKHK